jgi:hypothetical protein
LLVYGAGQGCQMANFETNFEYILEGIAVEDFCTFYGNLVYFTAIRNILCPFGIFYGYLEYFSVLVCTKKNLAGQLSKVP